MTDDPIDEPIDDPSDGDRADSGDHGGNGRSLASRFGLDPASVLDLSATLNPFAPDVAALVRAAASEVRHYPDATDATRSLAAAIGVDAERVVLTNGGAEAIALVARHLGRGSVEDPEFSLYRRHLVEVATDAPRWRSNPHNPTGVLARAAEQAAVWDEAFYPLASGRWTRGDDGAWRLGSLTKLWACPGLRIGFVLAPDGDAAAAIGRLQPAWAVNALALATLAPLLAATDLQRWQARLAAGRDELQHLLERGGRQVSAADAPWVLVHDATDLSERLLRAGIVTRDCRSFGLAGTIRIAVPGDDDLARVAAAL